MPCQAPRRRGGDGGGERSLLVPVNHVECFRVTSRLRPVLGFLPPHGGGWHDILQGRKPRAQREGGNSVRERRSHRPAPQSTHAVRVRTESGRGTKRDEYLY